MIKRTGRFGPFIASPNYPDVQFVMNLDKKGGLKLPCSPTATSHRARPVPSARRRPMYLREGKRVDPGLVAAGSPSAAGAMGLDQARRTTSAKKLELDAEEPPQGPPHAGDHPHGRTRRSRPGPRSRICVVPGLLQDLPIHPDAVADTCIRKGRLTRRSELHRNADRPRLNAAGGRSFARSDRIPERSASGDRLGVSWIGHQHDHEATDCHPHRER